MVAAFAWKLLHSTRNLRINAASPTMRRAAASELLPLTIPLKVGPGRSRGDHAGQPAPRASSGLGDLALLGGAAWPGGGGRRRDLRLLRFAGDLIAILGRRGTA